MNKKSIIDFLDRVTDVVKAAAPIAGIPLVDKVAGWADTAVEIAQNALTRAEDSKTVLTSNDKEEIKQKIAELQAINDDLNAQIVES